jgi:hypothetical protein
MRKLLAGLVVLVVFAICSSSYGHVVVYNMSIPVKAVNSDSNDRLMNVSTKGVLIMDIDEIDEGEFELEANLLLYGKELDGDKVYALLSTNDGNDFLGIDVWEEGEVFAVDFWSDTCLFNFESLIVGKEKTTKLGLGAADDNDIATRLDGVLWVWEGMLFSFDQDLTGTASVSATLNVKQSKASQEEGATLGQVTDDVIADLLKRHTKVNLPVCED